MIGADWIDHAKNVACPTAAGPLRKHTPTITNDDAKPSPLSGLRCSSVVRKVGCFSKYLRNESLISGAVLAWTSSITSNMRFAAAKDEQQWKVTAI